MEPYTLNRQFIKQQVIDEFHSIIWTERYYGDSEVELVVPATQEMIKKLPVGTFLGLNGSREVMILETVKIEDEKLKVYGNSLLVWMNNRFIRVSATHEDRYWYLQGGPPGWILWAILWNACSIDSPYVNGTNPIGISNPQQFAISGLNVSAWDTSGANIAVAVPYGPVYDAMREIATTYEVGMQITVDGVTDSSYVLNFRSYKGLDHTSGQSANPIVRFSPHMDSLTNIKELQSIAALKTLVYAFAPGSADELKAITGTPGVSRLTGPQYTGFDLRAQMVFADDVTTDMVGADPAKLVEVLNARALDALTTNRFIKAVDGEIVPENQFKYGIHYNLGDVIEVQGNSEIVQTSRVTEFIRAQDEAGEKAYPTVAMLG